MIRGNPDRILSRLRRCLPRDVGISSITLAELTHGVAKSQSPDGTVPPSRISSSPSKCSISRGRRLAYGAVRASLEAAETPIGE